MTLKNSILLWLNISFLLLEGYQYEKPTKSNQGLSQDNAYIYEILHHFLMKKLCLYSDNILEQCLDNTEVPIGLGW